MFPSLVTEVGFEHTPRREHTNIVLLNIQKISQLPTVNIELRQYFCSARRYV